MSFQKAKRGPEGTNLTRMLHCYAEGRDGGWEAICLDLDIGVQGDSFEEVYRFLDEAVGLYIESVRDTPDADRGRLMARTTPLPVRLTFLWHTLRTVLLRRHGEAQYADFTLPVP